MNPRSSERTLELRGAAVMLPVMQRVAEGYMDEHPETIVAVGGGASARGLEAVIVGVADVAMGTNELPEDLASAAQDRKVKLSRVDVFRDAIVPVVAVKNPVSNLTLRQLHDIFNGTITNWKDVGGVDAPIEIVSHEPTTGVYETFRDRVMGTDSVILTSAKIVVGPEYKMAITEHAIGYVGFKGTGDLKVLSVGGVHATVETIGGKSYPISRTSSLWIREPARKIANDIVDYLLGEKGQKIIRDQGEFPCTARVP
jgi:phosphate transport system substrate-binding protein